MAITNRNAKHSHLRTLCTAWLRKNKPIIYRLLSRKAADKYNGDKDSNNSQGSSNA